MIAGSRGQGMESIEKKGTSDTLKKLKCDEGMEESWWQIEEGKRGKR